MMANADFHTGTHAAGIHLSITDRSQLLFSLIAMALLTNACFLPPWVLDQSHKGPGKLVSWTARGFWSPGKLMECVSHFL